MTEIDGFEELQKLLANNLDKDSDWVEVVNKAKIKSYVDLRGSPMEVWFRILNEADKQGVRKVRKIVDYTIGRFPLNEELKNKLDMYYELYVKQKRPDTPPPTPDESAQDKDNAETPPSPEQLPLREAILINILLFILLSMLLFFGRERLQLSEKIPPLESTVGLALLGLSVIHVFIHYIRPRLGDAPGEVSILGIKLSGGVLTGLIDAIHPQKITSSMLWLPVIIVMGIVVIGWAFGNWPIPEKEYHVRVVDSLLGSPIERAEVIVEVNNVIVTDLTDVRGKAVLPLDLSAFGSSGDLTVNAVGYSTRIETITIQKSSLPHEVKLDAVCVSPLNISVPADIAAQNVSATLEIAGQVLNLPVDQLGRISFCLDGYAGESALFELKAPGYLNYTLDIQQLTSGSLPSTIELLADPTTEKPPDCSNGGVSYYVVTGERTREELEDNKLFISQNVTKDLIIEVRTDSGCEVSFLNPPNLLGEGELTVPVDRKVAENGFAELEVTYTAPAASTAPNDPIVAQLKFSLRLDGSESQVQFSPADLEIEVQ